jgi:hypothetical protein
MTDKEQLQLPGAGVDDAEPRKAMPDPSAVSPNLANQATVGRDLLERIDRLHSIYKALFDVSTQPLRYWLSDGRCFFERRTSSTKL